MKKPPSCGSLSLLKEKDVSGSLLHACQKLIEFSAEVLGVCYDVDLAVLQSKDAPVSKFLEFGDSNAVVIGQEVLTLGYPLGMDSLKVLNNS